MATPLNEDDGLMTAINVTPLVDVTLVLLVVLMITAGYVASQSIPVSLPPGATGASTAAALTVSLSDQGRTFLDGAPIDDAGLQARFRAAHAADADTQAVIAADHQTDHGHVVRVIELLRRAQITRVAIDVQPEDATN